MLGGVERKREEDSREARRGEGEGGGRSRRVGHTGRRQEWEDGRVQLVARIGRDREDRGEHSRDPHDGRREAVAVLRSQSRLPAGLV